MNTYVIEMLSVNKDNISYTTDLTINADNSNEAIIMAMNWLTENELNIVEIIDISKK